MATTVVTTSATVPSGFGISFIDKTVVPVTLEVMRTFPDAMVIASGIFALLTLSMPLGVFFGSMVEATLIFRVIRSASSYLNVMRGVRSDFTDKCRTGFSTSTLNTLSLFGSEGIHASFPSAPIFMLSTAAAYMFGSLNRLSKELQALGPAYSSRYYISAIFLLLLLFIFIAFRILYGCDTFGVLMVTMPIGLILGTLLIQQNARLFGDESINIVGIPLLRNRAANGKPLYICSTQTANTTASA